MQLARIVRHHLPCSASDLVGGNQIELQLKIRVRNLHASITDAMIERCKQTFIFLWIMLIRIWVRMSPDRCHLRRKINLDSEKIKQFQLVMYVADPFDGRFHLVLACSHVFQWSHLIWSINSLRDKPSIVCLEIDRWLFNSHLSAAVSRHWTGPT